MTTTKPFNLSVRDVDSEPWTTTVRPPSLSPFNLSVRDVDSEPAAELRISGPIGETFWDDSGTAGRAFSEAMAGIKAGRKINLRINSEGGSIQDGLEIYNAIKARAQDVTAHITGYALSIASVIPLAASKVVSPKSALWMVHKPWTYQQGDAEQMRKAAEMLDKHEDVLVGIYAEATGQTEEKIRKDLEEETWLTGDEAVAYGLADEASDESVNLGPLNSFGYRRAPAALGAMPPPQRNTNKERSDMDTDTKTTPSAGAATPAAVNPDIETPQAAALIRRIGELEASVKAERRNRINAQVSELIASGQVPLDQREKVVALAEADESALGVFAAMPKRQVPPPAGQGIEVGASCGFDHVMRKPDAKARAQFMLENWNELRDQGKRFAPQAANTGTDSATLLGTFIDQRSITVLQTRLAAIRAFALDASRNPMVPLQPTIIRKTTAGGTAQTNPTNFEDTTNFVGTVAAVTVTPAHIAAGGYITDVELNSGNKMDQWATKKAQEIAEAAMGVVTALILTGTFTTDVQTIAAASFGVSDLNDFYGLLAKANMRNAVLSSTYISKILPTDRQGFNPMLEGLYGWDGIFQNDYWTGSTANTVGFFCDPQAIGVVAGVPAAPPSAAGAGLTQTVIQVPGNIAVQRNNWFNTATRSEWFTLDIVIGAAVVDASAGRILKSA